MTIRPYKEQDKSSVINIYNSSKLDELIFEKEEFELIPLQKDLQRKRLIFESKIWVYEDKHIKGFVAFDNTNIFGLFVNPEDRGEGIGRDLLKAAISDAGEEIKLQVVVSNLAANDLYSRFGFEVSSVESGSYNGKEVFVNKMVLKKTS